MVDLTWPSPCEHEARGIAERRAPRLRWFLGQQDPAVKVAGIGHLRIDAARRLPRDRGDDHDRIATSGWGGDEVGGRRV